MIPRQYWCRAPSTPVMQALPQLLWVPHGTRSPAAGTAALMLYVALNFMAESVEEDLPPAPSEWYSPPDSAGDAIAVVPSRTILGRLSDDPPRLTHTTRIAAATYEDLAHATYLSRTLICQGLEHLHELDLIAPEGSHQKRRYRVTWGETKWFKLPCSPIVHSGRIQPFRDFTLRSKYELYAMKLYLYLAAVRSNDRQVSVASYETIFERTSIPERDIRRATSLLVNARLLASVNREHSELGKNVTYGHNQYLLNGYEHLLRKATVAPQA